MGKIHSSNNTEKLDHSKAARRHLRNGYAVEQRLRTLLDSISYGTVSGESCAELSRAFSHLAQAVDLLRAVECRESARYDALTFAVPGRQHDRVAA